MKGIMLVVIAYMLSASQFLPVLSLPTTAPAFLWFNRDHGSSGIKEIVNYRTISSMDLAKFVLSEGGWSNLLCSGENHGQSVDIALVFIGRKLLSSDISRNKHMDSDLIDLLKVSFTRSNFSMAFPYVAVSEGEETIESSLISGLTKNCGHGLGVNQIAFMESCSVEGKDLKKLRGLHSVYDYVTTRRGKRLNGLTDLILYCIGGPRSSEKFDPTQSEGEIFSELVSYLEQSGASYTILYVSDPYESLRYPAWPMNRFLVESILGNGSANSTYCDGVCQIKSSLLEGFFVGIVLLIILLSGLCCMMGIETPTRFETPQDS